jgi:hypothetical protein
MKRREASTCPSGVPFRSTAAIQANETVKVHKEDFLTLRAEPERERDTVSRRVG